MKKSNVALYVILAIVSIFLLWLWYFLGFNLVDEPLDLILSIIWWVAILASVIVIIRVEKIRKQRIRTIYVSDDMVFNSEIGSKPYEGPIALVEVMEGILKDLKYNFHKEDLPNNNAFPVEFIVHTFSYKDKNNRSEEEKQSTETQASGEWTGEVINTETSRTTEFESKEEMFKIINGMGAYNADVSSSSDSSSGPKASFTPAPASGA